MFKDRFEGVPETDLASKSEFEKSQSKKKVSAIPTRNNAWESGRKHHLRAEKDDDESSARKVARAVGKRKSSKADNRNDTERASKGTAED